MNNLGLYLLIPKWSKKLGGPQNFLALVGIGGYAIGKVLEKPTKKLYKLYKEKTKVVVLGTYTVETAYQVSKELEFQPGDKYNVLEVDKDAVLIEKIGDDNNPYFVDGKLLTKISDYK